MKDNKKEISSIHMWLTRGKFAYLDETLGKIILYYLNFMILTVGKHFVHKYL
jgi:hypothetical protein